MSSTVFTASGSFSSVTASSADTSTPLPVTFSPARLLISEALPRITAKCTSSRSCFAVARLRLVPPAATGSRITGIPSRLASFPARIMASVSSMAPMLHTRASAFCTASAASSFTWDMAGVPPAARIMLAQSFTVTKFVMHWTSGSRSLVIFSISS